MNPPPTCFTCNPKQHFKTADSSTVTIRLYLKVVTCRYCLHRRTHREGNYLISRLWRTWVCHSCGLISLRPNLIEHRSIETSGKLQGIVTLRTEQFVRNGHWKNLAASLPSRAPKDQVKEIILCCIAVASQMRSTSGGVNFP